MSHLSPPLFFGSSPLTRGKRAGVATCQDIAGLIPAHAGKTTGRAGFSCPRTAHPRSRGENLGRAGQVRPDRGSSPLTRGKHAALVGAGHDRGLIPAHAGKTPLHLSDNLVNGAHPRSRGENVRALAFVVPIVGSSPLTRGKLDQHTNHGHIRGLIPAHAGKTRSWARRGRVRTAHPRSRGENATVRLIRTVTAGSSPLTRGKRTARTRSTARAGLIPAHAGKTRLDLHIRGRRRAHPRSRGENGVRVQARRTSEGSSPLTRGKRWLFR